MNVARVAGEVVILDFGGVDGTPPLRKVAAGRHDWPWPVTVLDPLDMAWSIRVPDQLDRHAEALSSTVDNGIAAVVAHCMNAALAVGLARTVAARGRPPATVVLLAPVMVTHALVAEQAAALMTGLGADETAETAAIVALWRDSGRTVEAFDSTVAQLRGLTARHAGGLGLDVDESDAFTGDLLDRYTQWLAYLGRQLLWDHAELPCPVDVIDTDPAPAVQEIMTRFGPPAVRGHRCADPSEFDHPATRSLLDVVLVDRLGDPFDVNNPRRRKD